MFQLVREYLDVVALALAALWAVLAGSGVVAVAVTAIRRPERLREALRSIGRMFTD